MHVGLFKKYVDVHGPDVSEAALARYPELRGTRCHLWMRARTADGYGVLYINRKNCYAHRLALELHLNRKVERLCLHKCDNRGCVNPEHLFEGSAKENTLDMMAKKRDYRGKAGAKLSTDDNAYIRENYVKGQGMYHPGNCRHLAERFGVQMQTISLVARRSR